MDFFRFGAFGFGGGEIDAIGLPVVQSTRSRRRLLSPFDFSMYVPPQHSFRGFFFFGFFGFFSAQLHGSAFCGGTGMFG